MPIERLDKLIATSSKYTRSETRKMIQAGRVTVDGEIVKKIDSKVEPTNCNIEIDNLSFCSKSNIYIMMNKPAGVISASMDLSVPTVIDLLPETLKRKNIFPAGRLDKDTEGLLIITNDGEFAHKMLSPNSKVMKVYIAELNSEITEKEIQLFKDGIILKDGTKCLPATLKIINNTTAEVGIFEGKYHQVKRMFSAVGFRVIKLKRIRIGNLQLDKNLPLSEARELKTEELQLLCENYS